jgi:hypothetical protein
MNTMHCSLLSLGCAFGFAPPENQAKFTALRALKIAQRRLRPEVRSKLLSIASSRTDATLEPVAWRFAFLDPATSGNFRIVTVAAKTSSEHPDTVEAFSASKIEKVGSLHPIVQTKLLVDSDQTLEQARGAAKLRGVLAAEYRLIQQKSSAEPFWIVHFYAEGEHPFAHARVGAKTGAVELQCEKN